jgi:hypothetical protein
MYNRNDSNIIFSVKRIFIMIRLWKQFRTEQSAHNLMGVDLYAIQTYAEWPPKSTITHWAGIEK